jgi:hypothetical protein
VNGSLALGCVILAPPFGDGTGCNTGGNAGNVPAGSTLAIMVFVGGLVPAFDVLFGWRATT